MHDQGYAYHTPKSVLKEKLIFLAWRGKAKKEHMECEGLLCRSGH